jgi:hypothetical protein
MKSGPAGRRRNLQEVGAISVQSPQNSDEARLFLNLSPSYLVTCRP